MLKKYYDFLLENLINESYVYYISEFRKVLNKLSLEGNQIAKDLLEIEYTDIKADTTFVSLSKRDGYIGFSTMRNVANNVEKFYTDFIKKNNLQVDTDIVNKKVTDIESGKASSSEIDLIFKEAELSNKSRSDIKLGKFINKVLPDKYSSNEIEDFTNKFKALLLKDTEKFELVSGNEIDFWYNSENYDKMKGSLGSSCMALKRGIFELYVKNPEICKLLILKKNNKLLGRAIIWKLHEIDGVRLDKETWFMDRQYTIEPSDVEKFRNFAKENGWILKANNDHESLRKVYIDGISKWINMSVKLKEIEYYKFPYMDTFRKFDPNSSILYNGDERKEDIGNYILDSTSGGFYKIMSGIWSEYYDEDIPENFAVWSEYANSFIHEDRAVWVNYGSYQGAYPEDHEDLVWDGLEEVWLNVNDAVWSESYDYHLKSSEALKVIDFIYSDGEPEQSDSWYHMNDEDLVRISDVNNMIWYQKLSDEFDYWTEVDAIHKSLLTMNSNSEYILKLLKVDIYKVDKNNPISDVPEDLMGIEWLLKEDAFLLGWNVSDEKKIVDIIWYNNSIKSKINKLKSIADSDSKFFNLIKGLDHDSDWVKSLRSRRLDLFMCE
jgi:hypothetical protein